MRELCCLLVAAITGGVVAAPVPAVKPKFKLGKDTTYLTGPLDAEGFVDYETALNERLRGTIKPDENAVTLLVEVLGPKIDGRVLHPDFYKWLQIQPLPAKGNYYISQDEFFQEEREDEGFFNREGARLSEPWTAEDDPQFAKWLTKNEKQLAKVTEAVKRKSYFCPFVARDPSGGRGSLVGAGTIGLPSASREFARALSARIMLRCGEKKYDDAWRDVVTVARLGRHTARAGTLMGIMVGNAIEAIAEGKALVVIELAKPNGKQARRWLKDFLELPARLPLVNCFDGTERFELLDRVRDFRRKGVRAVPFYQKEDDTPSQEQTEAAMKHLDWEAILRKMNHTFDQIVMAAKLPTHAARQKGLQAVAAAYKREENDEPNNPFALLNVDKTMVALLKETDPKKLRTTVSDKLADHLIRVVATASGLINTAVDRQEQTRRNLLVAVALAGHFADTGKYPAKLADLAPKYLATVPDDLFSEKPLIYTPAKDGYLFYSVGVNGTDDDGKLFTDPFDQRGDDLGVRMPRPTPNE